MTMSEISEVEPVGTLFQDGQRRVAALGFGDAVAQGLDLGDHHCPHIGVVLHHQHAFRSARQGRRGGRRTGGRPPGARQEELYGRSPAPGALQADRAARLVHETVNHAEAKAGAVPGALGGEERLEGARLRGLVHAAAGVDHLDQHMIARRLLGRARRGIAHGQGQRAAVGHGVARIVGEVDDGAVELRGIDLDRPQSPRDLDVEHDLLADGALEEPRHVVDALADIEAPGIERLAARECQQAARQLGAALGAGERGFDQLGRLGIVVATVGQQVEIADDDRQVVVEVVRQPAGELADGLHALDLAQALLHADPFGDVDAHRHRPAAQRAVVGDVQDPAVGHPPFGDFPSGALELGQPLGNEGRRRLAGRQGNVAVLDGGRNVLLEPVADREHVRRFEIVAEDLAIVQHQPAIAIEQHDAVGHALDGIGEIVARAGELALGHLALGDVEDEALHRFDLAVADADRVRAVPHPAVGPVGMAHAVFQLERAIGGEIALDGLPDHLAVIGMDQLVVGRRSTDQVPRRKTEQHPAAFADELHGPVAVVAAAIDDAGHVGEQGALETLALGQRLGAFGDAPLQRRVQLLEGLLGLPAPGDVDVDRHRTAARDRVTAQLLCARWAACAR